MKVSQHGNFEFVEIQTADLETWTSIRPGEQKIGQDLIQNNEPGKKYLILGICEDLGPQANGGNPGASHAFSAFLPKFLSIQSTDFLNGKTSFIPGYIKAKHSAVSTYNTQPNIIDELDDFVIEILETYCEKSTIPVVIGGGHNNAYPLLKYFSKRYKQELAVVNCDAHADFRETDFRHSGNPFSFAFKEGIISKYAALGLHQSYNNQFIIHQLKEHGFFHTWFEKYVWGNDSIQTDFSKALEYFDNQKFGLELDMDAIEYMPSSASGPSGITFNEARAYVAFFARQKQLLYLHLPEASVSNPMESLYVGKSLAYLVSDFIKNNSIC